MLGCGPYISKMLAITIKKTLAITAFYLAVLKKKKAAIGIL